MTLKRTARGSLILLAAALAAGPASAHPKPRAVATAKHAIVFPVVGEAQYADDFGDPRGSRRHEGNDIMAERRAPAVAAEAGTVKLWTSSSSAGCMLYLYGDSGTTYFYIHLNNDRGAGNDNRGGCVPGVAYAPGLADGVRVAAGELVGFVGDSGDANGIHPHLHFEAHPGGGAAVDPFRLLKRARTLAAPVAPALAAAVSAPRRGRS
jgi:murein DD-endopeptidase MepM/ murein hydrolase activator NlpD